MFQLRKLSIFLLLGMLALAGCEAQPSGFGTSCEDCGIYTAPVRDRVFFDAGKHAARLNDAARAGLDQQAWWLVEHSMVSVTIEGHADDDRSEVRNLNLGEQRAKAVKDYLVAKGIAADRIGIHACGSSNPAKGACAFGPVPSGAHLRSAVTVPISEPQLVPPRLP